MKLLLTAFEPFGGESVNPALEAVGRVRERIGAVDVVKLTVPTVFGLCVETVRAVLERERPDAVLCVGQAGGRAALTPERVAINCDDASKADNAGNRPQDMPVVPGGPAAYFTSLPVKAMAEAIRAAGVRAEISNSAGTFVCNHLFYGLLRTLERDWPGVRGGFIHVPFLPEQAARQPAPAPSMLLEDIVRGLEAAIAAIGEEYGH